jgi:hypothetical protein
MISGSSLKERNIQGLVTEKCRTIRNYKSFFLKQCIVPHGERKREDE